jgi:hypothetical protein
MAAALRLLPFSLGLVGGPVGAHNSPSAFSKPAAELNPVFSQLSSTKRPLVTSHQPASGRLNYLRIAAIRVKSLPSLG